MQANQLITEEFARAQSLLLRPNHPQTVLGAFLNFQDTLGLQANSQKSAL
jgi:hypothetical protein